MVELDPVWEHESKTSDDVARAYRIADTTVLVRSARPVREAVDAIFRRLGRAAKGERPHLMLDARFERDRYIVEGTGLEPRRFTRAAPPGAVALELANAVAEAVCRTSGLFIFKAAVLERDGNALALGGVSRAGTTTIAAHLLGRGWRLVSDAYALVEPSTERVVPFHKLMVVAAASLPQVPRSFRASCEASPWFALPHRDDVHFYAVDPARAYGDAAWSAGAHLRHFAYVTRGDGAARLADCDAWSLAPQIHGLTWPPADLLDSMARMASAMRGVRTGVLTCSDPLAAGDVLERWIG
jgi:hypothetical protein